MFNDFIREEVYMIEMGGYYVSLDQARSGLCMTVKGFSQKIPEILTNLVDRLVSWQITEDFKCSFQDHYKEKEQ